MMISDILYEIEIRLLVYVWGCRSNLQMKQGTYLVSTEKLFLYSYAFPKRNVLYLFLETDTLPK